MPKIGIIIVNYKDYAARFLSDCVNNLQGQEVPGFVWKLYLVDNCSSKQSITYLKKQAPIANIIPRADGNYSAANRIGIERAKEDGCDYFVIANMDVIFAKNWLKELVKAVNNDYQVGIAQSKIMLYGKENKINSVGNIIHFLGFGFTDGYNETDNNQHDGPREITGYASGSSLIIKKEVIEKIGNYDPQYYMYHDDLELGWRARLAGYKIILAPQSIVYHKYEFSRSVRMLYYMERNRYIAIFSFYKLPTILLILLPLAIMNIGMLFYSIINGWFLTKLKVEWYFCKPSSWKHIMKTHRQVKKFRKVKDKDIVKNISGKVEYQEIMNPVLKYIVNPVFDIYWRFVRRLIFW